MVCSLSSKSFNKVGLVLSLGTSLVPNRLIVFISSLSPFNGVWSECPFPIALWNKPYSIWFSSLSSLVPSIGSCDAHTNHCPLGNNCLLCLGSCSPVLNRLAHPFLA